MKIRCGEGICWRCLMVTNNSIYRYSEIGHAAVSVIDINNILSLSGIPDSMIHNISSEEYESSIWHQCFDSIVHTCLQADRRITVMIAIGTSRRGIVARGISSRIATTAYR